MKGFSVKGKSVDDLSNLSMGEFSAMTRSELSKVVSRLSSTANKRMKRLEGKDIQSPAYRGAVSSGGKFGSKGKTLNELRSEYMRVTGFLKSKTSTVKGYRQVRTDLITRIGATEDELTKELEVKLWSVYNEMGSLSAFIQGSGDRQKFIYDTITDNPNASISELINAVNARLTDYYEESEQEDDLSEYFRID